MNALTVEGLTKKYPAFTLDPVAFSVGEGRVTGLVGANGAGKTTTLKSIVGLISSSGKIEVFGLNFREREREAKGKIGYVGGGFRYYPQKSVEQLARAVADCYPNWEWETFYRYLERFGIDETKKVSALSDGMKVKFYLSLALSHGARLLILDEPTSGLDPLSREDFCDTVLALAREGVAVLFSTHITSDLERIADDVVMLSNGKVVANEPLDRLKKKYAVARFESETAAKAAGTIGVKAVKEGFEGLLPFGTAGTRPATLDDILVHLETERRSK